MKKLFDQLCSSDDIVLKRWHLLCIILMIIPFASCSSSVKFSEAEKDSSVSIPSYEMYKDTASLEAAEGTASYYGKKFHNRKTASGEIYDMYGMTASHKSYPFGTIVRVTNLANGISTIVKVNDRLPKRSKRLIDLSVKAAETLEFIKKGLTKVKLEVVKWGNKNKCH